MNAQLAPRTIAHPEFRGAIGIARIDVTPPLGIYARLWGSARHDVAAGVHRPMLATALVLRDGASSMFVLVTIDVVALWQEEMDRIRSALLERFRLRPAQLIVHPSHTHSSPMLARRHAERPGGEFIAPYLDSLPSRLTELVESAHRAMRPSVLSWAYGRCALAFNRDAVDTPTGRGVCGLNPARRADDTVLVGRVTDADGRATVVLVNYACHPVSLGGANQLLSSDYPGAMRELVERATNATCVFLQGASGDLTPRRSYESDVGAADDNGQELGYAVLATLKGMLPPATELTYQGIEESGTALGVWRPVARREVSGRAHAASEHMMLPLKSLPTRETILERIASHPPAYELERLERMLAMRDRIGDASLGPLPVTVWSLGGALVVATSGEAYSQYQLELRKRFPERTIAVLNLANGATSYLPEEQAYDGDNYPARVTEYARGCLEQVTAKTIELIAHLGSEPDL